jgi:hypothetical protein
MTKNVCRGCIATWILISGAAISMSAQADVDNGSAISPSELTNTSYAFPSDLVPNASGTQKANYAWRLFIAANNLTNATLQDGSGRETPVNSFISAGMQPMQSNPTVFESFYHRTEAYPYFTQAGSVSPPIGQTPEYRFQPIGSDTDGFTVSDGQYVNLDETNQIGQNFLYYRESNDPDFPVLYMAKVNSVEINYAWNRAAPSASSSWVFPNEVMEVKAAWRRVADIRNSDPNRYHQAMASYYVGEADEVPMVKTEAFALIALHIIQKTANYPQFIFSTFEHVDSVTRDSSGTIIDPAYQWTSENLLYGPDDPTQASTYGAYTANDPGLPPQSNVLTNHTLPHPGALDQGYITVTQPKTITEDTNDVNNQVISLIQSMDSDSVWANYRLKGVQTIPTSDETAADFYLANIVVESSQPGVQLFRGNISGTSRETFCNFRENTPAEHNNDATKGCVISEEQPATDANNLTTSPLTEGEPVPTANVNGGGCQGCHGVAQTAFGGDFSFLVTAAGGAGEEVDIVPTGDLSPAELEEHMNTILEHRAGKVDTPE